MDAFVHIAASGARETMLAQAANTHNLANASTPGFRGDLVLARSVYFTGQELDSRAVTGMQNQGVDFSAGAITTTGRKLDVAVNGQGWIAIVAPDGTEAYSRRGDLRVDEFGLLLDGAGKQIAGNNGPIALPPFSELAVGADGTISIVPLGEDPNTLAVIDRIKLVNPDTALLGKDDTGLLKMKNGEDVASDAAVRLVSGSLEASNVNSVDAMVRMIELARQFETHVKMMKTAEKIDNSSSELMKIN
ncbi:MAG: flagellar basal-body rod protein FlgF [Halieaceae bacterium]|jgi:flagellar basal-body rod protein FlgF